MVRGLTPSAVATTSADRYGPYPSAGVAALSVVALMTKGCEPRGYLQKWTALSGSFENSTAH
jgi:hypothetical protein